MNRRLFLRTAAATASASLLESLFAARAAAGVNWPIGCFNRPWTRWSYDDALDGIRDAGYKLTGLLTGQKGETFCAAASTPEYLDGLKKRIAARGLAVNMTAIRFKPADPLDDMIKDLRAQIDNAARLELKFMLTFGVDKPEHYDKFYKLMADGAAYADKRGIHIVLKPHGGGSGASEEILRCMEKVAHANFKVWYDAGNIIFYTGKDPLAELEPVAKYVTGFCAKDCAAPRAEVMTQFGTGKVDFKAVFAKLKSVGFNGPIMVEGVKVGATAEETTANAKANREFLEKATAAV
jgi:sugar phosphate isomerase/epimerase